MDTSKIEITEDIERQLLDTALLPWIRRYTLESYERGLLLIDGKFEKELESGTYYWWKNATKIDVAKLDIRQQQLEVSGQEILTKDKANVRISFFAHYQVVDLKKALFNNKEFEKQLYVMLQISLREYIGEMTLDELVAKKERVSDYILQDVAKEGLTLGVELKTCGIRDIILPGEIKTIMNKVLIAEKTAQANMITQRQETASTRSLLNTAKLMEENQMLWKLKEMEYVEKIAEKINTISVSGNGQILDQLKQIFMKN
ncbi:MAG: slipin family protein [Cytophagales bacterium]|nr:slipin family protein [Cytophagales bacterium]